jgi:fucose 4-O-acetylase-like acetyltransferase
MNLQMRRIIAIAVAGVWINASEFFRNQVLLTNAWVQHFQSLGMTFPAAPVNALVWVVWGFIFAAMLYIISRRFSLIETILLGWVMSFLMMWLVTWNLNVLPLSILVFAIPLSLLECFVGAYICYKMAPR